MAAPGGVFPGWAGVRRWRAPAAENLSLAATFALFAVSAAVVVGLVLFGRWDLIPAQRVGAVWTTAGLTLALATVSAAGLAWRRPALRTTAILMATIGAILSVADLAQAPRAAALAAASAPLRDYRFSYDAPTRTLRASGGIGPGFAAALKRQLKQAAPARLEIASDGGLVREALAAARLIDRRGLTVVARDRCASACVILLMAGEARWADYDMALEFHAVSPVTPGASGWWRAAARREGSAADRYLMARGVPEAWLSEARRIGPDHLAAAPSIDLAAQGVLTGLIGPGGEPMAILLAEHDLSIAPRPARYERDEPAGRW